MIRTWYHVLTVAIPAVGDKHMILVKIKCVRYLCGQVKSEGT